MSENQNDRTPAEGADANTDSLVIESATVPHRSVVGPEQLAPELGGGSVSPDLSWSGAPEGTRSFAVTCYDPDAPTGSGFWHWVAWDIPGDATGLPKGVDREEASLQQAVNDFGRQGFDGPNPPPGAPHRYQFTVHALPVETLGVEADAPHVQARFAIFSQQLASSTLTATYQVTA